MVNYRVQPRAFLKMNWKYCTVKNSTECSFLVVDPLHSAVKEGSIPRVLPWYLYQYSVFVFIELVRWGKCVFVGPLVDRVWTRRRRSWKRKGNPVAPQPPPSTSWSQDFLPQQKCISFRGRNIFLAKKLFCQIEVVERVHKKIIHYMQTSAKHIFP